MTPSVQVLGDEVEAAGEDGRGAFQPAPRVTEADHKKDTKSLHRALDKRLFLLLKAEGGICSAAQSHLIHKRVPLRGKLDCKIYYSGGVQYHPV